jgi:hypothetical protein
MTNTEPISPSLTLRNRHLSEKTSMAHGLAKLLTGVLKYNRLQKTEAQLSLMNPPLVGHWGVSASHSPTIQADTFLITCIDRRLKPDTFLQRDLGEMFVLRNPGNNVPNASHPGFTARIPPLSDRLCRLLQPLTAAPSRRQQTLSAYTIMSVMW